MTIATLVMLILAGATGALGIAGGFAFLWMYRTDRLNRSRSVELGGSPGEAALLRERVEGLEERLAGLEERVEFSERLLSD